ncbi:MAG: MlaE family lipid ABC transporter permease subunit [Sphingomonadales bacterium]|jgi:phospholipid/cholesterol/gamma-HCH transport system permease protein|uniref:ABC transporter permease n=2 Tax=Sphingorhabdus sp. TaxID=1902408 RepID=UPI003BB220A5|nr:MlaE family lipid ABC transporter permease subunit [Sphingomonadales bacterium]MBK9432602.1 MlaE family lipid ABC transporter permease subunit [Sphingomonadales bacterium]
MIEPADFTQDTAEEGGLILRLNGAWTIAGVADADKRLRALGDAVRHIDLSAVEHIDTVGAWIVYRTARDMGADIVGVNANARSLIEAVGGVDSNDSIAPPVISPIIKLIGELGDAVLTAFGTMVQFIAFMGQCVKAIIDLILHPRRFRIHAVVQHFEHVGVRALAIVGLMSFLIGIVIAQQGAVQLRQFGAEVFTVNLVGRLTLRELGVLMTAIMVAGRSGSAFAAQIGTMKITEEVDAMRTIGVVPTEALVIPRIMATVVMMPLLAMYSSIIAMIGGGLLCWIALDIPPATFVQRIREVVPFTDLLVGLVKAPVFGAIIAMAGCFQGMRVEGNSEEVGLKTTAAVVQAIFLVIVLDAFFAVFFTGIGWN